VFENQFFYPHPKKSTFGKGGAKRVATVNSQLSTFRFGSTFSKGGFFSMWIYIND